MTDLNDDQLQGKRTMQKLIGGITKPVFAVRNKTTGRYAAPNYGFAKPGEAIKVWTGIGPARARITAANYNSDNTANYEVVELELFEVRTHPAKRK